MAIKYLKLRVTRSEMHQVVADFAAWEFPILEAMHQAVENIGDIIVNRDPPDAADEYARLERRYGRQENDDGSKGIPYVAAIFGQHRVGIEALRREIATNTVEAAPESAEDLLGALA